MKVGCFIPYFSVLSQTFLYEFVVAMGNQADVEPVVLTWERLNETDRPFSPVHVLPRPSKQSLFGIRAATLFSPKGPRGLPLTPFEKETARMIESLELDLVHVQFGPTAVTLHRVLDSLELPMVVSLRGRDASAKLRKARWQWLYRQAFQKSDAVTCVSPHLCDNVSALLPADREPLFIPAGKDQDDIPFRPVHRSPQRLLSVGRLVDKKGHDDAIRTVRDLHDRGIPATLSIIGEGPMESQLREVAKELRLTEDIDFRGAQTFAEVMAAMREHDCLIVPSRTGDNGDTEGIPNVLKEAQLSGLPVVATRHGGIAYAVPPEHRDDLVPERSPSALATAIQHLRTLSDEELNERVRSAREFMERNFSRRAEIERYSQLYRNILEGRAA